MIDMDYCFNEFVSFDFDESSRSYVYRFDYAKFYRYMQQQELQECDNVKK